MGRRDRFKVGKGRHKTTVYATRDKRGRFKTITTYRRSYQADRRKHARRKLHKSGYGHTGNY